MAEAPGAAEQRFCHLHNHSHYSLLDGLSKIPDMVGRVQELGMDSVALTDHGAMYGTVEFYKAAKKAGVKPIIGVEAYVSRRKHTDKQPRVDANPYHLVLLAESYEGYLNLIQLTTTAHLEGYYYKPRVDKELMRKFSKGIICLSACMAGELAEAILEGNMKKAEKIAREHLDIYGEGNYFLEMQHHPGFKEQQLINKGIRELHEKTGIPMVITRDAHYVNPDDREAHDVLLCVQTGKTITDTDRMEMDGEIALCSADEIAGGFPEDAEAMTNTVRIAQRCNVEITLGEIQLPKFEVPEGHGTEDQYLRELAEEGLKERYPEITPELTERFEFELGVMERMGYAAYFLIVQDFVNWAKDHEILVGPGRGSAAGSLVAYSLRITDLDPIKYGLLFERFLNPDRISMPDIDMDFADDRRGEVIDYVTKKYGADHVAQIITFGTMLSRAAVRDTGRALGYTYAEVDQVAKLIPQGKTLASAIDSVPEVRDVYRQDPKVARLLDMARRLEGVVRHSSVHAAGVVISKEPLISYTPVQRAAKGENTLVTQYSMGPIEDLGLLKMDFLGLANLSILGNALDIIEATTGEKVELENLPLDDPKTYELLSKGETTGIFQLESAGMKRYLKELKPSVFDDIIAMNALYRPGPMANIPDFIARKHGKQKVAYTHPLMEEALKETYGVIVYQEQLMQVSKDMAGFTGGEADYLRKAMGKKIPEMMAEARKKFVDGALQKGVSTEIAQKVSDDMEAFAQYAFNKSHAACYAMIGYQTAYLKAHYPSQYLAALLTSDQGDTEKVAFVVDEARRIRIKVLPPSVNESFRDFGVVKESGDIRFGLGAIKNVGVGTIAEIIKARKATGEFKSIDDFLKRVDSSHLNRKALESLIKAGALDELAPRIDLLGNIDEMINFASAYHKSASAGQIDIFGELGQEQHSIKFELIPSRADVSQRERLQWEKDLIGLYISEHPLDHFNGYFGSHTTSIGELTLDMNGKEITVGGIIVEAKKILTKSGESMAFVKLEDRTAPVELIVFPRVFKEAAALWEPDKVVVVKGKVSTKDRDGHAGTEIKILVDSVKELSEEEAHSMPPKVKRAPVISEEEAAGESDHRLTVELPEGCDAQQLKQLREALEGSPGDASVLLRLWQDGQRKEVELQLHVAISDELKSKLNSLTGSKVEIS
jgi:DNA polymerase-3 subunit alpha